MLLDLEGHVLGTSAAGYEALFGNSYDLSSDELPYIFNASGGDFSDVQFTFLPKNNYFYSFSVRSIYQAMILLL